MTQAIMDLEVGAVELTAGVTEEFRWFAAEGAFDGATRSDVVSYLAREVPPVASKAPSDDLMQSATFALALLAGGALLTDLGAEFMSRHTFFPKPSIASFAAVALAGMAGRRAAFIAALAALPVMALVFGVRVQGARDLLLCTVHTAATLVGLMVVAWRCSYPADPMEQARRAIARRARAARFGWLAGFFRWRFGGHGLAQATG